MLWEPRPGGRECTLVYDTTVVARVPAGTGREDVSLSASSAYVPAMAATGKLAKSPFGTGQGFASPKPKTEPLLAAM
jgi:hypothetical protein